MQSCRSQTFRVFGELLSLLLKIRRSAVRPCTWEPLPRGVRQYDRYSAVGEPSGQGMSQPLRRPVTNRDLTASMIM